MFLLHPFQHILLGVLGVATLVHAQKMIVSTFLLKVQHHFQLPNKMLLSSWMVFLNFD